MGEKAMNNWINKCHFGDCLETLKRMPDGIVQTCVTSPPYFGLRSYLPDGVKLRNDLSETDRAFVQSELCRLAINPINDGI